MGGPMANLTKDQHYTLFMLKGLTEKARKRYCGHFGLTTLSDPIDSRKWLTGEELLAYDRMMARVASLDKALLEYAGLTFSKSNGPADFSHIATTGRHIRNYK
jgi:hypothetical protein